MRVLINSINYYPELTGIGKYTTEMAEWLVAEGHEVSVVTAPPYYPAWCIHPGYSGWLYRREAIAGVDVRRCPLWVPRRPSGLKRLAHLLSYALTSLPVVVARAVSWKPQLIITIEPPLFCAPGVALAAKLCRATSWLHVQDYEVDAAFSLGILTSRKAKRFALWLERQILKRFHRVSSISHRMMERLEEKGVPYERREYLPNWVDTKQIGAAKPGVGYRRALNIERDAVVLLYSGNMGEKQGVEILVDAARMLVDEIPRRMFVLCGAGSARDRLERQASGLANVRFLPIQPLEEFNNLLNLADIHLLPQRQDAEDLVMPSKLIAMLASGRPVIATARKGTEVANVVKGCGLTVEPGNVKALCNSIQLLAKDDKLRHVLGTQGRLYATQHLDKDSILRRVFSEVLLSEPRAQLNGYGATPTHDQSRRTRGAVKGKSA